MVYAMLPLHIFFAACWNVCELTPFWKFWKWQRSENHFDGMGKIKYLGYSRLCLWFFKDWVRRERYCQQPCLFWLFLFFHQSFFLSFWRIKAFILYKSDTLITEIYPMMRTAVHSTQTRQNRLKMYVKVECVLFSLRMWLQTHKQSTSCSLLHPGRILSLDVPSVHQKQHR